MTEPDTAARTSPGSHDALGSGLVTSTPLGSLVLESGATVPDATLAWRHDGPGPGAPQIVVVHALTGSADAAGDWWTPLIGPGRAMDTDRVGVLCANLLGGCYGSTGPTSTDPSTGHAYGEPSRPSSTRDQADAIWRLLDVIGIERVALVTGGSLGGMVALELAALRPRRSTSRCRWPRRRRPVRWPSPGTTSSCSFSTGSATTVSRSHVSWR